MANIPDLLINNPFLIFEGLTNRLTSQSNGIATVSLAALTGKVPYIGLVTVGYSDTPTGGLLTVYVGANPIFRVPITTGGPVVIPVYKRGNAGDAMSVSLSAGGSGITGYVNVEGDYL